MTTPKGMNENCFLFIFFLFKDDIDNWIGLSIISKHENRYVSVRFLHLVIVYPLLVGEFKFECESSLFLEINT